MPANPHRYYVAGCLHFITTSCYQRRALRDAGCAAKLRSVSRSQGTGARRHYRFVVVGSVVMPEHVHLLFSELDHGDPSVVMKALKQAFARRLLEGIRALLTAEHRVSGRPPSSRVRSGNIASTMLLRFRCVHGKETRGEAPLHAPQSGGTRSGTRAGTMALEQLSPHARGERGPVLVNESQEAEMQVRRIV